MRVKFLRFLFSLTLSSLCLPAFAAGDSDRVLTQMTPHDRLYAVAFDGDYGLAVGHAGLMMETLDGGSSWRRAAEQPPTKLAMHGIAIAGGKAIAVGQRGLVLVRDGRGAWKEVKSGSDQRLLRVGLNKAGVAVAVGAFGTLIQSSDAGKSWKSIAPEWAALYQSESSSDSFAALRDEPTNYVVKVFDDGTILVGGVTFTGSVVEIGTGPCRVKIYTVNRKDGYPMYSLYWKEGGQRRFRHLACQEEARLIAQQVTVRLANGFETGNEATKAALRASPVDAKWSEWMAPIMKIEVDPTTQFPYLLPKQFYMA